MSASVKINSAGKNSSFFYINRNGQIIRGNKKFLTVMFKDRKDKFENIVREKDMTGKRDIVGLRKEPNR